MFWCLILPLLTLVIGCQTYDQRGMPSTPTSDSEPMEDKTDESSDSEPDALVHNTYRIAEQTAVFRMIGRVQKVSDGITCDHTASGIEFEGMMRGDVVLTLSCDRDTYFTVFVDGKRLNQRFWVTPEDKELVLASFETAAVHHIRVLKQTEPQLSLSVLASVSLDGYLTEAPAERDTYIEFIGDSLTCGYGNLAKPSTANAGAALWEDGTETYAFLAAEQLNADADMISCSGIAIDRGWTSFSMADLYDKVSFFRDAEAVRETVDRIPDVVVINLGSNDELCGSTKGPFMEGVRALIGCVRARYGDNTPIVWAYNMGVEGRFPWTLEVLNELGGEAAGLYHVALIRNRDGGNSHPSLTGHRESADLLASFLREKQLLP